MSRHTAGEQQCATATSTSIDAVIARVVQRELTRHRAARQRAERRRVATERARQFEKVALATVARV